MNNSYGYHSFRISGLSLTLYFLILISLLSVSLNANAGSFEESLRISDNARNLMISRRSLCARNDRNYSHVDNNIINSYCDLRMVRDYLDTACLPLWKTEASIMHSGIRIIIDDMESIASGNRTLENPNSVYISMLKQLEIIRRYQAELRNSVRKRNYISELNKYISSYAFNKAIINGFVAGAGINSVQSGPQYLVIFRGNRSIQTCHFGAGHINCW